jgi:hypothetical protein
LPPGMPGMPGSQDPVSPKGKVQKEDRGEKR